MVLFCIAQDNVSGFYDVYKTVFNTLDMFDNFFQSFNLT